MENSMTSMNKENHSKPTDDSYQDEESSWTFYFEDFMCNNNNNNNNNNDQRSISCGYESPSLVSDAASMVSKKLMDKDEVGLLSLNKSGRSLSFKKRKTKGALGDVDHALEDTASSPVNSPKEKGNTICGEPYERSSELGMVGRESDYTELKKRGLCLVPVSMFANYLG